ncbi:hypothetical protein DFJ73DRAFT_794106 [Zopfochytrium polystomum]|nr:hypothetical protein DFJ73DRAFT_794106 [Zopfochytrium polystomum]
MLSSVLLAAAAAATAFIATPAAAFTNGTILPNYLCGPSNDGLPKSLGGVLALLEEGDSKKVIAGYHGDATSLTAGYGLATATSTMAAVIPGQQFPITITSAGKVELLGLLTWFEDQYGKLGYWSQFGAAMQAHPGCTAVGVGGNLVPVVATHSLALADANPPDPAVYTGLVWQAPPIIYSTTVMVKGLAVIEGMFGFWNTTFTVQGATTNAAPFAASGSQPQRVLKCTSTATGTTMKAAAAVNPDLYARAYAVGGLPPRRK